MPDNIYLAFSQRPEALSADEYGRWYEGHLADILAVDGFVSARRFTLEAAVGSTSPTMYAHLAAYTLDGDPQDALRELSRALGAGAIPYPEWFSLIRFASFIGQPLEGPIDLAALDHCYMVFSKPPAQIATDAYNEWYATHMRENLTATGFERAWRYAIEPDQVDPKAPCEAVHAALYEVHGELPELRVALKEAADAGRVGFPEWFGEILFASLDAHAASGVLTPAHR